MAEALAAVGVAASFIQLTDACLRTCLCLYSFFSALHKSRKEFQRHVNALRDVHNAIQLVRKTTASQALSPTEEAMLHEHILSITQELSSLEKITAGKDPTKRSVRMRWVMAAPEMERILQELEYRKTSLILLLQTLTLGRSSRLLDSQDGNKMRLQVLQLFMDDLTHEGAAIRSDISKRLDGLDDKLDTSIRMYKESLDGGFSTLTRDREIRIPEELLSSTIQRALDNYILPKIEESYLKRSELQNAATLQRVQKAIGHATEQILNHAASTMKHGRNPDVEFDRSKGISEERGHGTARVDAKSEPLACTSLAEDSQVASVPDNILARTNNRTSIYRPPKANNWSLWSSIPLIGTFRIQFGSRMGEAGRFWTMQIDFWPSSTFLLRKCISLKYSSSYDQQEYVALFPSLAVYPIISDQDPIWTMIDQNDLYGIKLRFRNRDNGPYDQNDHGITLLSYALDDCHYRVAEFLLTQGADPTKTTACGRGCLDDLIFNRLSYAIEPHMICPYRYQFHENDFPLFFSIFHSLIARGCDLDSCNVSIFDFLTDQSFAGLEFNRWDGPTPKRLLNREEPSDDEGGWSDKYEDESTTESFESGTEASKTVYKDTKSIAEAENSYLATIRQLAQFLNRQGLNLVKEATENQVSDVLDYPERMTFAVLRECGLNSNYREPSRHDMASILYHGLYCFRLTPYVVKRATLMDNLISMISGGADVYDVEWASEVWSHRVDDGVMSPTAYAKAMDLFPIWRNALKMAGYDPDEVALEDEKRRREFQWLHGGASSSLRRRKIPQAPHCGNDGFKVSGYDIFILE